MTMSGMIGQPPTDPSGVQRRVTTAGARATASGTRRRPRFENATMNDPR
jgi:hypothetical protein